MSPISRTYFDIHEFKKSLKPSHLYIIPIGGCGMFGMNMTCYLYNNKMIIADAGSLFPEPWMVGISMIIPSPEFWLFKEFDLLGYFITHAHEDHIGALPYILKTHPKPIYTTPWTAEVLKKRLMENRLDGSIVSVEENKIIDCFPFSVKFHPIGHSIPDASCLLIKAGNFHAFHSGDFKFNNDDNSLLIPKSLQELRQKKVDLFLCDSTNAEKNGACPQEESVCEPLRDVIAQTKGNVYLASFSSNLMRFKWISEICKKLGKSLYISGTSLRSNFELGVSMGLVQPGSYKEESEAPPVLKNSVVLMSGCQGEYRSALARLANNEHRYFKLQENDVVIFSSRTIPGNEKNIVEIIDKLRSQDATIITTRENPGIHVSGHAYGGEISALLDYIKPKTFIPVHGTYTHQQASCLRNPAHNSLLVRNGDIIEHNAEGTKIAGTLRIETVYVDEEFDLLLSRNDLLEKLRLAKKGVVTLSGVISLKGRKWLKGPNIRMNGLVKDEVWAKEFNKDLKKYVTSDLLKKETSTEVLSHALNAYLCNELIHRFGSKPMTYCDVWILD